MLDDTTIDTNADPATSPTYREWNPQVGARRDIVVGQAIVVIVTDKDKQLTWMNFLFGHLWVR